MEGGKKNSRVFDGDIVGGGVGKVLGRLGLQLRQGRLKEVEGVPFPPGWLALFRKKAEAVSSLYGDFSVNRGKALTCVERKNRFCFPFEKNQPS